MPILAHDAVINGVLVDSQDTTELIEATVKLLKATKDSTMVKGTTTDFNGVFNIGGVGQGPYVLKFSYVGYHDLSVKVSVGADGKAVFTDARGKVLLTEGASGVVCATLCCRPHRP